MKTLIILGAAVSLTLIACSKDDTTPILGGIEPISTDCATVSPAAINVHIGDTVTFHATNNARCPGAHWWWRSSSAPIATVDSTSGLVLAKGNGSASIIATANEDNAVAVAANVTVTP